MSSCRLSESLAVCGVTSKSTARPRSLGSLYWEMEVEENGWKIRPSQPRFCGVEVGVASCPHTRTASASTKTREVTLRLMSGKTAPKAFGVAKILSNPLSIVHED